MKRDDQSRRARQRRSMAKAVKQKSPKPAPEKTKSLAHFRYGMDTSLMVAAGAAELLQSALLRGRRG